jgi:hypothetical protein
MVYKKQQMVPVSLGGLQLFSSNKRAGQGLVFKRGIRKGFEPVWHPMDGRIAVYLVCILTFSSITLQETISNTAFASTYW